jgi:Arc/MetJ-type ribon-helix-helix transcriptional regulator
MELRITTTPEQEAFIRDSVSDGRFPTAEDAAQAALALWAERERRRIALLTSLDSADESLARGEARFVPQEKIGELLEEVKRRGRARWNSQQ